MIENGVDAASLAYGVDAPSRNGIGKGSGEGKLYTLELDGNMQGLENEEFNDDNRRGRSCYLRWKTPGSKEAIQVLCLSVVLTVVLSVVLVVSAYYNHSTGTLAVVVACIIDSVVSITILTKLSCGSSRSESIEVENKEATEAEERDYTTPFVFILLSIAMFSCGVYHLVHKLNVRNTQIILATLLPSFFILLILGSLKLHVAKYNKSKILLSTSAVSFLGAKLSLGITFSTLVIHHNADIWWLDSMAAIFIAIGLLSFAGYSLYFNTNSRIAEQKVISPNV